MNSCLRFWNSILRPSLLSFLTFPFSDRVSHGLFLPSHDMGFYQSSVSSLFLLSKLHPDHNFCLFMGFRSPVLYRCLLSFVDSRSFFTSQRHNSVLSQFSLFGVYFLIFYTVGALSFRCLLSCREGCPFFYRRSLYTWSNGFNTFILVQTVFTLVT